MWRKRCLWSYGLAEFARKRYSAIELELEKVGDIQSEQTFTKVYEHREKVHKALDQYHEDKKAKGEPPSDEEMQQIKAKYADPDVSAEEEYTALWHKVIQHPKFREHSEQEQADEEKIRREMGDAAFELARIS